MKEKCPICGKECRVMRDYLDGHTLLEETIFCPDKHYGYEFAYGSEITYVGELEFHGHWKDSGEEKNQRENEIKKEINRLKSEPSPTETEEKR